MDKELELLRDSNIIRDPKVKRLVEYSENSKQINILDTRFYRRDDKFYPSVTSVSPLKTILCILQKIHQYLRLNIQTLT